MFDKDIAILKNKMLRLRYMITIYAILGGVLSVVVNLASSPSFDAGQFALAFSAGMGWPALATGISAGKKVGDVNEEAKNRIEENTKKVEKIEGYKVSQREAYIAEKRDDVDKTVKKAQELFDKELEEVKEYYIKRLSSAKGGE
jgi:uncharacterized protein (UPF0297 family)